MLKNVSLQITSFRSGKSADVVFLFVDENVDLCLHCSYFSLKTCFLTIHFIESPFE